VIYFRKSSGSLVKFAAIRCLGQRQVAPELLQMRGHDCPSEGLRPLWRVEPDLERDRDSHQRVVTSDRQREGSYRR